MLPTMDADAPATPPAKPRRGPKPKSDTRDNLVRAGARLLHQTGYAATGVKDIVDAAQVPKGSFYNHFDSKEAFGAEVVDFYFGRGLPDLRTALTDSTVPPLARLKTFFEQRVQRFESGGHLRGCMMGNLSLEVADHSAIIRERLALHFQTWGQLFEGCIAEAQASGALRNPLSPAVLAHYLLDSWEGALVRMRVDKSGAPLQRFLEVTFTSLLV
jgi:TetR/AcrR family transcriptional repressor of nem operon